MNVYYYFEGFEKMTPAPVAKTQIENFVLVVSAGTKHTLWPQFIAVVAAFAACS